MSKKLQGQAAAVTEASKGIGAAMAVVDDAGSRQASQSLRQQHHPPEFVCPRRRTAERRLRFAIGTSMADFRIAGTFVAGCFRYLSL